MSNTLDNFRNKVGEIVFALSDIESIQETYRLAAATELIVKKAEALITEARIDGGKLVFESFRDLWGNPPVDTPKEDAYWNAVTLHEMLDGLEADWIEQLKENK